LQDEFRCVVNSLPGLVWTSLPDGYVDFLNQDWCDYTGLSLEEACGWGWNAAICPEDLPGLLDYWRSILASGEPGEVQARMRRFDGKYRWFLFHAKPSRGASGKIVRWYGTNTDIEDRKVAEEALREGELHFRLIVDNIPGLVSTRAATGAPEFVNRQMLEFFGQSLEQLPNWSSLIHPDDRERVVSLWRHSVETGQPYDVEHRARRADGVYRWIHARGQPLRDPEGRIVRWCNMLTDVDDRKHVEEALRESELHFRLIVDRIPGLIQVMSAAGEVELVNRQALEYFGKTLEEFKAWETNGAMHPDDLPRVKAARLRSIETGYPFDMEYRCRRADGVYRWFHVRALPLRDTEGRIIHWYALQTDIEDRKRSEAALKRSEEFLADAQRLSSTGSFLWNLTTGEIIFSEETYRIYGIDPGVPVTFELIGARTHPEDLPELREHIEQARLGLDLDFERRLLMPDRSVKHLHFICRAARNQAGQLEYIGAVQDVTERRLSEDALGKVRSELAHVARVATLGALTASIAHEVNQPLSGIITNASTCLRMLADDPPNIDGARETARRTIRDGNRASDVIARLHALFAKKGTVTESVDLNKATRELIALSSNEIQRERVTVRMDLADDLPPVAGDCVQLQQVVLNLLMNALEAMRGVDDRPRQLVIRTERDEGDRMRLSVQDVGVGFHPQSADRLFDAFYTTKDDGMGIGLSVSRSIIESHRGRLWAELNDGPGATFSFSIPRASAPVATSHRVGANQTSAPRDAENVMRNS